MELKLAKTELDAKPKEISLEKLEEEVNKLKDKIYYFDKENSHKKLIALAEFFEEKGYSVYHRIVRYGLDENDYMYEVHIL